MRKVAFIVAAALLTISVSAQDVDRLRDELKKHEQEITRINKLISNNSTQQKNATQNLNLLKEKIESRKKIVKNLDSQIAIIEQKLGEEGTQIVGLNTTLGTLKESYTGAVKLAYLNYRNNSAEVAIGSQSGFSESIRNIANIRKITEQCMVKAVQIDTTKTKIERKVTTLKEQQAQMNKLLSDKRNEAAELEKEHKLIARLTKELASQSDNLKRQAAESRNRMQMLQKQIQTMIAQESKSVSNTPINTALSGEFEQNKGRLPAPVSGGVVVERFGVHNHPTQAGIKVSNNGVNIACEKGSLARAVFSGEVKRLFAVPGMGYCIIVRHGKFLTVYSNLGSVSVKAGDSVKTGEVIGTVTNSENILHFEVWNETTMLDPENWISI